MTQGSADEQELASEVRTTLLRRIDDELKDGASPTTLLKLADAYAVLYSKRASGRTD